MDKSIFHLDDLRTLLPWHKFDEIDHIDIGMKEFRILPENPDLPYIGILLDAACTYVQQMYFDDRHWHPEPTDALIDAEALITQSEFVIRELAACPDGEVFEDRDGRLPLPGCLKRGTTHLQYVYFNRVPFAVPIDASAYLRSKRGYISRSSYNRVVAFHKLVGKPPPKPWQC